MNKNQEIQRNTKNFIEVNEKKSGPGDSILLTKISLNVDNISNFYFRENGCFIEMNHGERLRREGIFLVDETYEQVNDLIFESKNTDINN
ncbi:MAG: hypothetical protein ACXVJN_04270 [Mucilaginibacter sp.]